MRLHAVDQWLRMMVKEQCLISSELIEQQRHIYDDLDENGNISPIAPMPKWIRGTFTIEGSPHHDVGYSAITFTYEVPVDQDCTPLMDLLKQCLKPWLQWWRYSDTGSVKR